MKRFTVLFSLVSILIWDELVGLETGQKPQVIFLNGPTSSGKTTLAKALQNRLETPFLYISLDQIIEMMPAKVNQWIDDPNLVGFGSRHRIDVDGSPLSELIIGPFAARMRASFVSICSLLLGNDYSLIIDDIFFQAQDIEKWERGLQNINVLWVYLASPLEVLEEREKIRGNPRGCARYQYLHAFQKDIYDIVIDTSSTTLEECVDLILNY